VVWVYLSLRHKTRIRTSSSVKQVVQVALSEGSEESFPDEFFLKISSDNC
jgi:hypothetical protein